MIQEITKVRKHFYADPAYYGQWIAYIVGSPSATTGYIQPDGTGGKVYGYDSKEEAEVAAALYVAKNVSKDLGVETSAGETKESNPKYDAGIKKAPLHCIPCGPLFELGLAMFEGSRKYGRHNYRAVGVRASVYYDASIGHIIDWWEGEDIDPDSGVHHLIKAMACLLVVRDSQLMGNFNDDRPLRYTNGLKGRSGLEKEVADIVKKYPNCVEPYLETNKGIKRQK